MIKKIYIIQNLIVTICMSFCTLIVNAQGVQPIYAWAKSMGGSGADYSRSIAVDGNGNVYVTGQFDAAGADFNPGGSGGAFTSAGRSDVFLVKYNPNGNFLWAKSIGGTGNDVGRGVSVDGNGNVYVTGFFNDSADFDPGAGTAMLNSKGGNDIFLAKYDPNGNYIWAKSIGGTTADAGNGITVDGNGNVYVTGEFRGSVDFDPGGAGAATLNSVGNNIDVFIAKYNSNGNYVWAKSMGGSSQDVGYGIAIDDNGYVYVTGRFQGAADFDPGTGTVTLNAIGGHDVFVARYDPNGSYVWAKRMGGTGTDYGLSVAVDGNGNVYVTGYFNDSVDFDPGTDTVLLTSAGRDDIFVARYDPNGNYVWAKRIGGNGWDVGSGVTLDNNGYVYVTGYFSESTDFDPGAGTATLVPNGSYDIFIARYDPDGNYMWAKSMGGTSVDYGYGVTVDDGGNVYVAGSFGEAADFDPGEDTVTLAFAGTYDGFVLKLSQVCQDNITFTESTCSSYVFNGITYTRSGTYTDTFTNIASCDSIVTLHLTINNNSSTQNHIACDSYVFNNTTYNSSGTYTATFTNAVGCDSVVTLNLTVNHSAENPVVTGNYCDSITFNDRTYTASGTYVQEYKNVAGCDSNITYQLTIHQSSSGNLSETACNSFTFNDSTYTETGRYIIKLPNANGCDSTVTLLLDINTVNTSVTQNDSLLSASIADSYQWLDCDDNTLITGATGQQYTASRTGNYAVIVSANGCTDTSECILVEIEPVSLEETTFGNSITLYPNPTEGYIHIKSQVKLNIRLTCIDGKTILDREDAHKIDISMLAKGIYMLHITDQSGTMVKVEKIVKL